MPGCVRRGGDGRGDGRRSSELPAAGQQRAPEAPARGSRGINEALVFARVQCWAQPCRAVTAQDSSDSTASTDPFPSETHAACVRSQPSRGAGKGPSRPTAASRALLGPSGCAAHLCCSSHCQCPASLLLPALLCRCSANTSRSGGLCPRCMSRQCSLRSGDSWPQAHGLGAATAPCSCGARWGWQVQPRGLSCSSGH